MPKTSFKPRSAIYYDTLINCAAGAEPQPRIQPQNRLFNGTNLGLQNWTNMVAAGQFPSTRCFDVERIGVDICLLAQTKEEAQPLRELLMSHMHVTLCVGDQLKYNAYAKNLIGHHWVDAPPADKDHPPGPPRSYVVQPPRIETITIPPRQCFYVLIDFYPGVGDEARAGLNRPWDCWRCVRVELWGKHHREVM